MENVKDLELWCTARIESMRVNGSWMYVNEREWKYIQTVISMRVTSRRERLMERAFIIGQMERSMMVNGKMELRKVMACGKVFLETHIWDNGKTVKLMAMESISGKMVIDTKEPG